jgi:thiol-disulfide isomerase/thioredoxin
MTRTPRRHHRLIVTVLAACGLMLAVAAPAHGAGLDDQERSPHVRVVGAKLPTSDKVGLSSDPAIGKVAPKVIGLSLTAKKATIGNDGKPHVVLFLSHSCPHCQAEVPLLTKLAAEKKLSDVHFDTVVTNTTKQLPNWPPSKWLRREHWPFRPVLADDAKLRAFQAYGGTAFPYFVLVGADGKVLARAEGELPEATVTAIMERLANGQPLFEKRNQ